MKISQAPQTPAAAATAAAKDVNPLHRHKKKHGHAAAASPAEPSKTQERVTISQDAQSLSAKK